MGGSSVKLASIVVTAAVISFGLADAPAASAQEVRTWTDSTGDFTIRAKFVSVKDGVVTLQEQDGSSLEIELKKLSAGDQKYVAERHKASSNPFRKTSPSPFRKKGARTRPEPGGGDATAGAPAGEGRVVTPDWSDVRTVAVAPASTEWKIAVEPAPTPAAPARLRPAPLPPKTNFFEGSKGLVINAAGTRAAVGYAGGNPGQPQQSRVVLCDLEHGKIVGMGATPGAYVPLALDDEGSHVLVRTDEFGPGKHDRLEMWSVGKSGITRETVWVPYEGATGANGGDRDVRWAAFLDGKRLATVSEAGKLVVWQVEPLKPLYTLGLQSGCTPGLSPDRKLMAIAMPKEIGVLDVGEGDMLALQPAPFPNMAWTTFAFSASGKRLACQVFVNKIFTYEVTDGSKVREIPLMGLNPQQPVIWPDEDHLLVGGHTLIDLDSQVRLWQYLGNERVAMANGLCWFEVAAGQNQGGALVPAKLPQNGVKETLARALRDPNFFILKPGSSVAIEVTSIPDASRGDDVIKGLTESLAKNDVRVEPGSPLVVQASIEQGKEEEITYRTIGRGFQRDRFKVRPWIGRVKFVYQGKVAWETSASTVPMFEIAHLNKDESLQDHVRKFERPNYAFFGHLELPKLLTRPTGQPTLGTSQVTLAGVR